MKTFKLDLRVEVEGRTLREVLQAEGWTETSGGDWDLRWIVGTPRGADYREAGPRALNHLPGASVLWLKDRLHRTLSTARALAPRRYAFVPQTFLLPEEYELWLQEAEARPDALWIAKPDRGSHGRGVALIEPSAAALRGPHRVVQEYVRAPALLNGFKHTLRLYLLLRSFSPLRAWMYRDGVVRCAALPYTLAPERRKDGDVHLTNRRGGLPPALPPRDLFVREVCGAEVWARLRDMLQAIAEAAREPAMVHVRAGGFQCPGAFALLGVDALLDARGQPWLLECNLCPSLVSAGEPRIQAFKRELIRDTLRLAGALPGEALGYSPLSSHHPTEMGGG